MSKIKKLFSTPKRAVISTILIVVLILAIAAAIGAVIFNNVFVGKDEAKKTALKDAGLSESDVSGMHVDFDYDDGRFEYEVEFYSDGVEYEYVIQASDGGIISRDIDGGKKNFNSENSQETINDRGTDSSRTEKGSGDENKDNDDVRKDDDSSQTSQDNRKDNDNTSNQDAAATAGTDSQSAEITVDEAKAAALADANLAESDVTFTKNGLDNDGKTRVYDIEFYTSEAKYDYEIYASNGAVKEKSVEAFYNKTDVDSASQNNSEQYIGVDRAKEIALNHAGLTEDKVQFSKAMLEKDDGVVGYEISFYSGNTEYEYNIGAVSGNIIEFDYEQW